MPRSLMSLSLIILAGCGQPEESLQEMRLRRVRDDLKVITAALVEFEQRSGRYPDELQELAEPDGELPSLLDQSALLDPWQRPYRYTLRVLHPETGVPRVYVLADGVCPKAITNW